MHERSGSSGKPRSVRSALVKPKAFITVMEYLSLATSMRTSSSVINAAMTSATSMTLDTILAESSRSTALAVLPHREGDFVLRRHHPVGRRVEHPEQRVGEGRAVGREGRRGTVALERPQHGQVLQPELDQVLPAAGRLEGGEIVGADQEALGGGEQRVHLRIAQEACDGEGFPRDDDPLSGLCAAILHVGGCGNASVTSAVALDSASR